MFPLWIFLTLLWTTANAVSIQLLECPPPDEPIGGGYGPKLTAYQPGDTIHYFCEVDSFIGGNYLRKCLDTGAWTGDAPVCDSPSAFLSTNQTSTLDHLSESDNAFDGDRITCSSTEGAQGDEWTGIFLVPGELIRVMLFLPKGQASLQVILLKPNGEELLCGSQTFYVDRYDWTFQNCPGPNNRGASGVKIKSLSSEPLRICEIQAYVLTSPTCTDPHVPIENGRLKLSRKKAVLSCDAGYRRSRYTEMECIRDGEWNRKQLFCGEPAWEETDEGPNRRPINPDREVERIRPRPGNESQ